MITDSMAVLVTMRTTRRRVPLLLRGRDILGGNGVLLEYAVARRFTEMEAIFTDEDPCAARPLILSREITGLQAFSRSW